ncbi:MAG: hypothetical protein AAB774_01510 [Patescibacteria group bacterium]
MLDKPVNAAQLAPRSFFAHHSFSDGGSGVGIETGSEDVPAMIVRSSKVKA